MYILRDVFPERVSVLHKEFYREFKELYYNPLSMLTIIAGGFFWIFFILLVKWVQLINLRDIVINPGVMIGSVGLMLITYIFSRKIRILLENIITIVVHCVFTGPKFIWRLLYFLLPTKDKLILQQYFCKLQVRWSYDLTTIKKITFVFTYCPTILISLISLYYFAINQKLEMFYSYLGILSITMIFFGLRRIVLDLCYYCLRTESYFFVNVTCVSLDHAVETMRQFRNYARLETMRDKQQFEADEATLPKIYDESVIYFEGFDPRVYQLVYTEKVSPAVSDENYDIATCYVRLCHALQGGILTSYQITKLYNSYIPVIFCFSLMIVL